MNIESALARTPLSSNLSSSFTETAPPPLLRSLSSPGCLLPCTQLKVVSQNPLFLCYPLLDHTVLLPPFRCAWLSLFNQYISRPCHLFSNWCIFLGPSSATLRPMLGHWTSISASHPAHSLPSHYLCQTCFFMYFTQLSLLRIWPSLNLQSLLDALPLQFIILTLHWLPSLPGFP